MKPITKAIIPVAGLGTRFYPATKVIAKEMLPVYDTPVIELIAREAVAAGITDIIFVISPAKQAIHQHFTPDPELEALLELRGKTEALGRIRAITDMARFHFRTQDVPLGDGHAILMARDLVEEDESVLVLFGDDLVDNVAGPNAAEQLLARHAETGASAILLTEVEREHTHMYGIVAMDDSGKISHIVEKPAPAAAPSCTAIVGKFVLTPTVWRNLMAEETPHLKQEVRLVDALTKSLTQEAVQGVVAEGIRFDTGDKQGFLAATMHWAGKVG